MLRRRGGRGGALRLRFRRLLLFGSRLGAQLVHRAGDGLRPQVQLHRRGGHFLQVGHLKGVAVLDRLGDQLRRFLVFGGALDLHQLARHAVEEVDQLFAALLQRADLLADAVEPQLVGVLHLVGFGRRAFNQAAGLGVGLFLGGGKDGAGLFVRLGRDAVRLAAGVLHDLAGLLVRFVQALLAFGAQRGAVVVQIAPLDAQLCLRLGGLFLQRVVLFFQVGVFQLQHGALVAQGMVFLLQAGDAVLQLIAAAGGCLAVPGQGGALLRQAAVLRRQGLAVLLQGAVLLAQSLGVVFGPLEPLLIFYTKRLHRLAHILRFIAAEARLADTALLYEFGHVDFWHNDFPRFFTRFLFIDVL